MSKILFMNCSPNKNGNTGLGQSGELLADAAGTGNWLEGQRFRSNPSDDDIKEFTDSLAG